jgi:hypothetical protein
MKSNCPWFGNSTTHEQGFIYNNSFGSRNIEMYFLLHSIVIDSYVNSIVLTDF